MQSERHPIDPLMFQLSCALVREGLAFIERLQEKNYSIEPYKNWPGITWSEGMPEFTFGTSEPPTDYKDAFSSLRTLFLIGAERRQDRLFEFEKFKEFRDLRAHLRSNEFPKHVFPPEFPEGLVDSAVKTFIETALDRFIHLAKTISFDEDRFLPVYLPLEAGFLWADLPIEIHVPILRLTTAPDVVDFEGGIAVTRMSEEIQLARAYRDHNTHDVNEYLLHQASHALVLKDHSLPNGDYRQRYWGYTLSAESVEIVDAFFACLRVVTGLETGYAQILFVPLGWAHDYQGDLASLQGLTVCKYPPSVNPVSTFYGEEIPWVPDDQVNAVRELLNHVLAATNRDGGKRLKLAIKRLNSCYMREDPDDAILDATIGLELLTSDGDSQEVTHKLALRLAALSTLVPECEATPAEVFRDVKKRIYPYRSAVVHGDDRRISKLARASDDGPKTALRLAIQYLGMAVRAIAQHPDFLTPSLIDERLLLKPSASQAALSD